MAARGGNLKKEAGGGLEMHWMFLHLLAARQGNLNVFVLGLQGVAARGARECIGSGVTRCLSVLVC